MEEFVGKKIDDKNDRIDEETSEGENIDSVIPTVGGPYQPKLDFG